MERLTKEEYAIQIAADRRRKMNEEFAEFDSMIDAYVFQITDMESARRFLKKEKTRKELQEFDQQYREALGGK